MKNLRRILTVFRSKGYHIHTRPFQLNLVGIRNDSTRPNSFDDIFAVFFKDQRGRWNYFEYPCTTDPGTYYLKNPIWQGTAILAQGQYLNAYKIGTHAGKYTAIVQRRKEVTVIRDYNRDAVLDFLNGTPDTGFFGINIHRASPYKTSKVIHRWSAGCQVLANPDDFEHLMSLARRHKDKLGSDYFTYTLIDFRATRRAARRRTAYGLGVALGLGLVGAIGYGYLSREAA